MKQNIQTYSIPNIVGIDNLEQSLIYTNFVIPFTSSFKNENAKNENKKY